MYNWHYKTDVNLIILNLNILVAILYEHTFLRDAIHNIPAAFFAVY